MPTPTPRNDPLKNLSLDHVPQRTAGWIRKTIKDIAENDPLIDDADLNFLKMYVPDYQTWVKKTPSLRDLHEPFLYKVHQLRYFAPPELACFPKLLRKWLAQIITAIAIGEVTDQEDIQFLHYHIPDYEQIVQREREKIQKSILSPSDNA